MLFFLLQFLQSSNFMFVFMMGIFHGLLSFNFNKFFKGHFTQFGLMGSMMIMSMFPSSIFMFMFMMFFSMMMTLIFTLVFMFIFFMCFRFLLVMCFIFMMFLLVLMTMVMMIMFMTVNIWLVFLGFAEKCNVFGCHWWVQFESRNEWGSFCVER